MSGRAGGRGRRATPVLAAAVALAAALILAACGGGNGASPGASGTVDGAALAASFVRILADPNLRANVVQQATATTDEASNPLDFRVTMSGVLALPDVDLELVIEAEGQSTRFRIVVVGDRAYVDLGEGWVAAPPGSVDTTELTQAFVVVSDPGDLEYVGTEQVDGQTLCHLVTTRPLPYTPGGFGSTVNGTATMDDLDAYVEADGTPVRIQLSFTATGSPSATGSAAPGATPAPDAPGVVGTTEIRFSDVGGGQRVEAPSIAPSAPASSPSPAP